MDYPKWTELTPTDRWSSWRVDDIALGTRMVDTIPPMAAGPEPSGKIIPRRDRVRPPASGVPYVYRNRNMWQVRIPGVPTVCFKIGDLDLARAYVAEYVEGV